MQKITIKEIQHNEGDNKPFVVITMDGAKMSSFDTKLGDLKPGAVLEVELQVKGKYTNIKEWKLVNAAPASTPLFPSALPQPAVDRSLEIACLKEVGELYRNFVGDPEVRIHICVEVCNRAFDKYWQIIDRGLDNLLGETKAPDIETKPAAAGNNTGKSTLTETAAVPEFKASHELFNYALKRGFTIEKLKDTLGISSPSEVKDIKAATIKLYPTGMYTGEKKL